MSDSEGGSQLQGHGRGQGQGQGQGQGVSFGQGNFSATLLPPILDIAPAKVELGDKEIVTYSKEVQTSAWTQPPEEEAEEDGEELVRRRVEEELRRELEKLKLEEQRLKEEEQLRLEGEKEVPGIMSLEKAINGSDF